MAKVAITTVDNPYDPFDQIDKWSIYDSDMDYNTAGILARIAHTSDALLDEENDDELERAIDEIIASPYLNPLNIYKKVRREDDGPSIVYPPDYSKEDLQLP